MARAKNSTKREINARQQRTKGVDTAEGGQLAPGEMAEVGSLPPWFSRIKSARETGGDASFLFVILHRFHSPNSECLPGEEVAAVWLVYAGCVILIRLSTATKILFDYFARHRWLPETATQIAIGLRREPFYAKHGQFADPSRSLTRRFARSLIKTYVERIQEAISEALRELGIAMNGTDLLVSESTSGNEVTYRLRGKIEWVHDPDPDGEFD